MPNKSLTTLPPRSSLRHGASSLPPVARGPAPAGPRGRRPRLQRISPAAGRAAYGSSGRPPDPKDVRGSDRKQIEGSDQVPVCRSSRRNIAPWLGRSPLLITLQLSTAPRYLLLYRSHMMRTCAWTPSRYDCSRVRKEEVGEEREIDGKSLPLNPKSKRRASNAL